MTRTLVGVLRGGTSGEYPLSLKTGARMIEGLPEDRYDVRDIFIDKQGYWHARGFPTTPARALSQVDVVLSGLHGGVGEDGTVQRVLERAGIPYSGSSPMASAHALNKVLAREVFLKAGIKIPQGMAFAAEVNADVHAMAREVFARFGPPYVLKPPMEGASLGIRMVPTIAQLPQELAQMLSTYGTALVEEYIRGEEATVGLIEGFRGEDLYALPPAFVDYPEHPHVHFDHHLEGHIQHFVPSTFSHAEKKALMDAARMAHRALGLDHYSRADFILTKRGPYLLEVNSLPGLHEHAAFPKMLESVGSSVSQFLDHLVGLARRG